jgi:hypothetical protein
LVQKNLKFPPPNTSNLDFIHWLRKATFHKKKSWVFSLPPIVTTYLILLIFGLLWSCTFSKWNRLLVICV